jgi:predicted nucleic acid-binding protein
MIAADTSTWITFLEGGVASDTRLLEQALRDGHLLMVPAVLTELLSDPKLPASVSHRLTQIPLIETQAGYWERAGALRAKVLARGRKARLGDALIAQSCIDRGIPLITSDRDFRGLAAIASSQLVVLP